jgi:hypothetical protein
MRRKEEKGESRKRREKGGRCSRGENEETSRLEKE